MNNIAVPANGTPTSARLGMTILETDREVEVNILTLCDQPSRKPARLIINAKLKLKSVTAKRLRFALLQVFSQAR